MPQPWTEVAAEKRAMRDEKLSKVYGYNNEDSGLYHRILAAQDVQELTRMLEAQEVSAEAIVIAHIRKAQEAQAKTNCLTEIYFDEALDQAKELDSFQQAHGHLRGPLHGIPISLKDQFNLAGMDSTLGYVGRAFAPASSDALLVQVLKGLGAVIIAKTNVPQSILWCETENPLWGLTTHPKNPEFTPGGSSGGEAALLALHGSFLGWGTDIGGSIRIPSHMNGLWGLKPSSGRISYQGVAVSQDGQIHIPSVVGPMARSLLTLTLATKSVIEAESWTVDPQLLPIPWREDIFQEYRKKPLVIGVMLDDGSVKVHPPVERVFREICRKLEAAGHELVPWDTSLNADCIGIMDEHYVVDGGEDIRRDVVAGGEPFLPRVQALVDRVAPISVYEYWQLNKRKIAAQQAYSKMWNCARSRSDRSVDLLLVPTMPHTATPHRTCHWVGYTKLFNFLDYTALAFPAGQASKDVDGHLPSGYIPRNTIDAQNWSQYNNETMDGHTVGLQLVGRRLEEEKVLGAAHQIQKLL